jgi:hypothetical protein
MSNYYIVPFTTEEYRDFCRQEFRLRVDRMIFESALRAKRQPERVNSLMVLEAYCYTLSSRRNPELVAYDVYPITMFLSEGYLKLYEDIGLTINVQRVIPSEDLPEGLERTRSGTYQPKKG